MAIAGGLVFLAVAAWLWLSAPPSVYAPDFLSAHEERLYWVAGFASWGVLALLLGSTSAITFRREVLADRLAASGYWAVWIASAGAGVLSVVANL